MTDTANPRAIAGDNSTPRVAADQLKSFVDRVERLEEEKQTIADDIKDVYSEAKSHGYETKVIRHIIRRRKQDRVEREEFEALVEIYEQALSTPLMAD